MGRLYLTAALLFIATDPGAQTLITPDEFFDAAEGKTLTFNAFESGGLVGIEQFLSRSLSVWKPGDGECVYGQVTVEGRELCFRYDDRPDRLVCWLPFSYGDQLMVHSASLAQSEIQIVTRINTDPIPCPNAPTS